MNHARAHWLMFRLEFRRGRFAADISMFKCMPIPTDLKEIIDGHAN
jgi:hypothetical protein